MRSSLAIALALAGVAAAQGYRPWSVRSYKPLFPQEPDAEADGFDFLVSGEGYTDQNGLVIPGFNVRCTNSSMPLDAQLSPCAKTVPADHDVGARLLTPDPSRPDTARLEVRLAWVHTGVLGSDRYQQLGTIDVAVDKRAKTLLATPQQVGAIGPNFAVQPLAPEHVPN